MSDKKPTIDELLAAVQQADTGKKRKRIENHSNTLRYIQEAGIEAGDKAVPNFVIYWHYRTQWNAGIGNNNQRANKIVFFRTFSKKFPAHRVGNQRYYLLKENCIEINDQVLEEAKLYDKKYVRFKKDKKTEEKQGEVPSNSSGDETP
jgi:hypothetical protein